MVEKVCEIIHENLDDEIRNIKIQSKDHEERIVILERISHSRDVQIGNILDGLDRTNKSIDQLVSWIKWGLAFLIPAFIAFFSWLLQQQMVR